MTKQIASRLILLVLFYAFGADVPSRAASGEMCFYEHPAPSYLLSTGKDCSCAPYTTKEFLQTQKAYNKLIDPASEYDEVSYFMCSDRAEEGGNTEAPVDDQPREPQAQVPNDDVQAKNSQKEHSLEELLDDASGATMNGGASSTAYREYLEQLTDTRGVKMELPGLDLTRNPFASDRTEEADAAFCRQQDAKVVEEINIQIAALHQSTPSFGSGPQVEVGSCASRLKKLSGNFLCCKTYTNYAAIWEEISCLELKKFYLRKTCECRRSGGFSTDEALQDGIIEKYAGLQLLRRKALKEGIRNSAIRAYVSDANELLDCFNENTLGALNSIESRLGYELNLQ